MAQKEDFSGLRPYSPGGCNGSKVGLLYPSIPVGRESLLCNSSVLQLPKRPLVDDIGVASIVE